MEKALLQRIKDQYQLNLNSDHGIDHWNRVNEISQYLSKETGADTTVVSLFAYLHDSKRIDEDYDPEHGVRAALFINELYEEKLLDITLSQFNDLVTACKFHSQIEIKPANITIATCWDADRLDLCRLGATPDPEYLFSNAARKKESLNYSYDLNNTN
jgi:uncharacterized protein